MSKKKTESIVGSLKDRILKTTNLEYASIVSESELFKREDEMVTTSIPILNLALSGRVNGGMASGLDIIAGPSKHFKTTYGLVKCSAFQKKFSDGIILFYDNEFGTPKSYLSSSGLDLDRIVHLPIMDIEQLKNDMVNQLQHINRDDHVMIFVDSIGTVASKREISNAIENKQSEDMSRAKAIKSLMRIILPYLRIKQVFCTMIAHTYMTLEMFSKQILGGGTGTMYSANNVWFIGKSQEKDDSTGEIEGYNFNISIDKSRFVKEKKKFPIYVSWENGIEKFSGLADLAEEFKIIKPIKIGRSGGYEYEGLQVTKDDVGTSIEFWTKVFKESNFKDMLEQEFRIPQTLLVDDTEIDL